MLYKNIKHASSENIEVINEINKIKFDNNTEYFLIAKKEDLYIVSSKSGSNLIIDGKILKMLKDINILGGMD
jgi:hypothetical protein